MASSKLDNKATTLKSNSTMNTQKSQEKKHYFDPDLLLLDLERIRIFIGVLEEYEETCEKEERFPEAVIIRDKIKLLRDVEEVKILNDLSKFQTDQLEQMKKEEKEELERFEEQYNLQKSEIKNNGDIIRAHIKEKHSQEEAEVVRIFDDKYPTQPKFSSEVLNLQKQMEEFIKKKEYEQANETKIKIIQMCSEQENKWKTETYEKKLKAEKDRLHSKQSNELQKIELKIKLALDEHDKRSNTLKSCIEKKYRNKLKDMLNDHVNSQNNFKKPSKISLIKKISNNTFGAN